MKYVAINFPPSEAGSVEYIAGRGETAERAVEILADKHLRVPVQSLPECRLPAPPAVWICPEDQKRSLLTGTEDNAVPWFGDHASKVKREFISWNPETFRAWITQNENSNISDRRMRVIYRHALNLVMMRRAVVGASLAMHGALLYYPERNLAAVIFGESGMGKSTAARRFAAQGGVALSDDRLLLTFSNDGKIYAQPLPTWSVAERLGSGAHTMNYPVNLQVPVGGVFLLFRGEDDKIAPADDPDWMIQAYRSVFTGIVMRRAWFPLEARKMVLEASFRKLSQLKKRAGTYQILGDLDGGIYNNLSDFMKGTI